MSTEITLHPQRASRDDLRQLFAKAPYRPTKHLWNWPKGSLHYHWFDYTDYRSYDGVEITIYQPSEETQQKLGKCQWALHTRTRAGASPADKQQQNEIIRTARRLFGGKFYNDWHGFNRYTPEWDDSRDATSRGIYLTYEYVVESIHCVRGTLPLPNPGLERSLGTPLEGLALYDPTRVLYNALVPFIVATLEHFFSQCFKILLHYEPKAIARLKIQTRKIEVTDALAIQDGAKTIEDVVADWYSFQSLASINTAFNDWFGIDVWKLLRRKRKVGKRIVLLEKYLTELIEFRHGIVHRLELDRGLSKPQIEELLDSALVIIDTFVDFLEQERGKHIRH